MRFFFKYTALFPLLALTLLTATPAHAADESLKAPTISSSTHPDQNSWYSKTEVDLSWNIEPGATTSQIAIGKLPHGEPSVSYPAPTNTKHLTLSEGAWFFHVREKSTDGWSATTDFKIQIDTTSPDNLTVTPVGSDKNNPSYTFSANDTLSGIDHYAITIDQGDVIAWQPNSEAFKVPSVFPGNHLMNVKALDKAGNATETTLSFTTTELTAPHLEPITTPRANTDKLTVTGATYPNTQVTIWTKNKNGEASSQVLHSDTKGDFSHTYKNKLAKGTYTIYAEVITPDGLTKQSDTQTVEVTSNTSAATTSPKELPEQKPTTPFILALILIVILAIIIKVLPKLFKKAVKRDHGDKDVNLSKNHIEDAFNNLKNEIVSQIEDNTRATKQHSRKKHHIKKSKRRKNFINRMNNLDHNITKKIERLEKK